MKILHVVANLPRSSGVSVFLCELASKQVTHGNEVSILVKCQSQDTYPVGDRVKLLRPVDFDIHAARFNIVHIHALWNPWLTQVARRVKKLGCRVVWSPHGMLTPWALKNKWPKKIAGLLAYQYWSLRRADLIHATAQSEVEDVRRLHLNNDVVVAPLGVQVSQEISCNIRRQKYIAFVSRIQRKKGLMNLINAWASLPTELTKSWSIKIAGPDEENHVAELRAQCERLGVASSIQFLGPLYGGAKDSLYANAAFSVLPTYSENFGSVVIESLAQNTPVICTKGAPWLELVDYRCGWWIDIGIIPLAKALAEAMKLFDSHPSALLQMGENGRKLVDSKYTWESVAKKIQNAYEEIINK